MDVKITKKRLLNLISYDWIKIAAFSLAFIFLWVLLFTTCATRATVGEQFYFVIYDDITATDKDYDMLSDMKSDGTLSYDVLTSTVSHITKAGNYSAAYMLSLRASTNEGDVMLAYAGKENKLLEYKSNNSDGEDSTTASGEKAEKSSDIYNLLYGNGYFIDMERFLSNAKNYLSKFVDDPDGENPTINAAKIESYFRNVRIRSARNYKKTYNTEAKIAEGVKDEIKRIETLATAYKRVTSAIAKAQSEGNDFYRYYMKPTREEGVYEKKAYGIDLYALNRNATEDKQKVSDRWTYVDENDQVTSEGITLLVFDFGSKQEDLQYESLCFIDYIIRNFSNYAD